MLVSQQNEWTLSYSAVSKAKYSEELDKQNPEKIRTIQLPMIPTWVDLSQFGQTVNPFSMSLELMMLQGSAFDF